MLVLVLVACSNFQNRLGSGGERYTPEGYVPDSSSDTGGGSDSDTAGVDTSLPETTSYPYITSLELSWGTDAEEQVYAEGVLTYWDNPDDVIGGLLYVDISGSESASVVYNTVDAAGWDDYDNDAAVDTSAATVTFRYYYLDSTGTYTVGVNLKDDSGYQGDDTFGDLAPMDTSTDTGSGDK